MLYDPKWEIKVKADPLSLEGLIAWLEKQPDEAYSYTEIERCPLARYFRANGFRWAFCGASRFHYMQFFVFPSSRRMPAGFDDIVAYRPHTYSAALDRARAAVAR